VPGWQSGNGELVLGLLYYYFESVRCILRGILISRVEIFAMFAIPPQLSSNRFDSLFAVASIVLTRWFIGPGLYPVSILSYYGVY
jgi:hypothetical protein